MADFHFSVTQIKRSAGQSAIAAAAYRAGEKLYSDLCGEYSDYTRKLGIVETGILLPSFAPKEYENREKLWNAVEQVERHPKAQLAFSFDFSLQNEFSMKENLEIAREFIQKQFVDRGMIADYAVHLPDKGDAVPNPHVHVLCPIRPLDPDGTWGAKQKRVYRLDEAGNRILDASGRAQFDAVPTTDWGSAETLEHWREAWAEINNEHFAAHNLDARLDHRSYEKQGVDLIPTVHEGPKVREMESQGIRTEKCDRNRWIRQLNAVIRRLKTQLRELSDWIANLKQAAKPEPSVYDLLAAHLNQRNAGAWSFVPKNRNLKEHSQMVRYLQEHGITTKEDLSEHIRQVKETADPVQTELHKIRFTKYLMDWLKMMKPSVEPTTYSAYDLTIRRRIVPYFDENYPKLLLKDVTPKHIQDYYTYELEEMGVSANTVIHRHANIRKALQYAYKTDLIKSNPADKVQRPKKTQFESVPYNGEELEELFTAVKGTDLELGVILAAFYGLRRSEVVGLKWDAVDFDRKVITIRHTVTQTIVDGKYVEVARDRTKTKSSHRSLPLVPPFEALLMELKRKQAENRELCKSCYCEDYRDYIYVNPMGYRIKPGYLTQAFPEFLENHGLRRIRFHDLRHSCATLLYANGVALKDIQEWLGHSDIGTTVDIRNPN